jgi:hypothetical protein
MINAEYGLDAKIEPSEGGGHRVICRDTSANQTLGVSFCRTEQQALQEAMEFVIAQRIALQCLDIDETT